MKIHVISALSLAANLVLAALLFHKGSVVDSTSGKEAAAAKPGAVDLAKPAAMVSQSETRIAATVNAQPGWRDFETDDLKELVARLRNANCPANTIEDLALAELKRRN